MNDKFATHVQGNENMYGTNSVASDMEDAASAGHACRARWKRVAMEFRLFVAKPTESYVIGVSRLSAKIKKLQLLRNASAFGWP